MTDYFISLAGLKRGSYHYDFTIDKKLFSEDEVKMLDNCHVVSTCHLILEENICFLNISLNGTVDTRCDICNEPLQIHLKREIKALVNLNKAPSLQDETHSLEILPFDKNTKKIHLSSLFHDYILLSMVKNKKHPDGECPADFKKQLHKYEYKVKTINRIQLREIISNIQNGKDAKS